MSELTLVGDLIDEMLSTLEHALEHAIDERGGFAGPVRPEQRLFSWALDWLAHGRDADSLDDRP